jgi:hypothetical protein
MTAPRRPPVWICGFPRCGSASLCQALKILGWNPIHNPRHWDDLQGHDAAGDVFVTAHWRALLAMFPQARFILNTRPFPEWVESLKRIPGFWKSPLLFDRFYRLAAYGTDDLTDRERLAWAWMRHHDQVRSKIPSQQLLVLEQPFSWPPLCDFLGLPCPTKAFPWLNRRSNRDARVIGRLPRSKRR